MFTSMNYKTKNNFEIKKIAGNVKRFYKNSSLHEFSRKYQIKIFNNQSKNISGIYIKHKKSLIIRLFDVLKLH